MSNLPTPIYLALTTAATEQRKAAQISAGLPARSKTVQKLEREYEQAKAEAEQQLSVKAKEVEKARGEYDALAGEMAEAQTNVKIGQDMVRMWCEANNRPVPDMPPLTMPFPAVQSAPIVCSRCGEVLYQQGNSWVDGGQSTHCAGSGERHVAVTANGGRVDQNPTSIRHALTAPADWSQRPVTQAGPVPAPDHVMPCPACGGQRYQEDEALLHVVNGREDCPVPAPVADPATTLTDPPATTPTDGA